MAHTTNLDKKVLCPCCGEFFAPTTIVPRTGWCKKCTNAEDKATLTALEVWLSQHADHIEYYIIRGHSLAKALHHVRHDLAPICASCGGLIRRAAPNAVFCRTKPQCRRAAKRYVYLYTSKSQTKTRALAIVLTEIGAAE